MKKFFPPLVLVGIVLLINGCANMTSGHRQFFSKNIPTTFSPTKNPYIFRYPISNKVDLTPFFKETFGNLLLIGQSDWNGPLKNRDPDFKKFAGEIGSDVVVAFLKFKETKSGSTTTYMSTPTTSTSYISSGLSGATVTTYGSTYTPITIPYSVDRYDHTGKFLKNVKRVKVIWEMTSDDCPKNLQQNNKLVGLWKSEHYTVDIYKSDNDFVGIIQEVKNGDGRERWKKGDLKFRFNSKTGLGLYLMGDKAPMPSTIKLDDFGYLQVQLYFDNKFAFERIKLK